MTTAETLLETARRYLRAIEDGATGEDLAAFYTPDAMQRELPNRLLPNRAECSLAQILEAAERGRHVVAQQRYGVRSAVAIGSSVAMEAEWRATLKVQVGSIPAGGEMRAHFALFLDFREGKIAAQRNYDCFEPW